MNTTAPTPETEPVLGEHLDRWINDRIDANPLLTRVFRPSAGMKTFWQVYGGALLCLVLFAGHKPHENFDPRDPATRAHAAALRYAHPGSNEA